MVDKPPRRQPGGVLQQLRDGHRPTELRVIEPGRSLGNQRLRHGGTGQRQRTECQSSRVHGSDAVSMHIVRSKVEGVVASPVSTCS